MEPSNASNDGETPTLGGQQHEKEIKNVNTCGEVVDGKDTKTAKQESHFPTPSSTQQTSAPSVVGTKAAAIAVPPPATTAASSTATKDIPVQGQVASNFQTAVIPSPQVTSNPTTTATMQPPPPQPPSSVTFQHHNKKRKLGPAPTTSNVMTTATTTTATPQVSIANNNAATSTSVSNTTTNNNNNNMNNTMYGTAASMMTTTTRSGPITPPLVDYPIVAQQVNDIFALLQTYGPLTYAQLEYNLPPLHGGAGRLLNQRSLFDILELFVATGLVQQVQEENTASTTSIRYCMLQGIPRADVVHPNSVLDQIESAQEEIKRSQERIARLETLLLGSGSKTSNHRELLKTLATDYPEVLLDPVYVAALRNLHVDVGGTERKTKAPSSGSKSSNATAVATTQSPATALKVAAQLIKPDAAALTTTTVITTNASAPTTVPPSVATLIPLKSEATTTSTAPAAPAMTATTSTTTIPSATTHASSAKTETTPAVTATLTTPTVPVDTLASTEGAEVIVGKETNVAEPASGDNISAEKELGKQAESIQAKVDSTTTTAEGSTSAAPDSEMKVA